ncbi:FtsX-like permease family protein [Pseudogemmobacter bohemicus]|uniref:FtsX-like permease family protein n=1 Tax=Pseudogemmobacter bohemicus TaxID=2250708 RepID=UPI000DD3DF2A|nr:FtsX-like permease family protein [Pseudogemmobacter bohemicus]
MRRFVTLSGLALRDLLHGWPSTLCLVVAVAVALVPVLLLGGLSQGVVENTLSRLRSDPRILELKLANDQQIPQDWFDRLALDGRVGFLLPRARYLAASVRLRGEESRGIAEPRLIPTAPGDPLLAALPVPAGLSETVLTERIAQELEVGAGTEVEVIIQRQVGESREAARHKLKVLAVLPRDLMQSDDIFVDRAFETAVERWREGYAVPELGWEAVPGRGLDAPARTFASFRLYARDIRDVPGLRDGLMAEGFDVTTRAEEIEAALALEAGIGWVFSVIGSFTVLGFALTLGLHLAAAAMEKAREISLLRLMGFGTGSVAALPSLQGAMIALAGAVLAAGGVLAAQPFVNHALAGIGGLQGEIMALTPLLAALAVLIACGAGMLSGCVAGWRIARMQIAEGLRHD